MEGHPHRTDFSDLPWEIVDNIFTHTPARQLPRWRRVMTRFNDEIRTSTSTLANQNISKSLDRLQDEAKKYTDYDITATDQYGTPTTYMDALLHFLSVKTEYIDTHNADWMMAFDVHWLKKTKWQTDPQNYHQFQQYFNDLSVLRHAMNYLVPVFLSGERQKIEQDFITHRRTQRLMLIPSSQVMEAATNRFRALAEDFHPRRLPGFTTTPPIRLYGGVLFPSWHPLNVQKFRNFSLINGITVRRLARKFGVPTFDSSAPVTYCVRSQWARVEIINALANPGQPIHALKMAALVEELYIA